MPKFLRILLLLPLLSASACVLIADYEQDQGAKVSRLGQTRVKLAVLRLTGFSPDYQRLGLDGERLREELSAHLGQAGIELLTMQQAIARAGTVLIDVKLVAKQNSTSGIYSYAASVKVWDKLMLGEEDDSRFTSLPVWRDGLHGIVQDGDIRKLQAVYLRLIERFIADNAS